MPKTTGLQAHMGARHALQRAVKRKESVRIAREGANLSHVYGFPLAVGRSLVLLSNVDDFDVNGFVVLPLHEIADVRSNEIERFFERALRDDGQLRKIRTPAFPVAIDEWASVFGSLAAEREIVIVECEHDKKESFCIGVVTGLSADSVGIHQFDVIAHWDSAPTTVQFSEITQLRFDERYTNVYAHYVDDAPPPSNET